MNRIQKVEIWAATGIYLLVLMIIIFPFLADDGYYTHQVNHFYNNGVPYDHFLHTVWPGLLFSTSAYGGFLILNFQAMPQFIEHQRYWRVSPFRWARR